MWANIFVGQNNFLHPIFFLPKIFWTKKFFVPNIFDFFYPNIFWPKHLLVPKLFVIQNFLVRFFCLDSSWPKLFLDQKLFGPIFFFNKSNNNNNNIYNFNGFWQNLCGCIKKKSWKSPELLDKINSKKVKLDNVLKIASMFLRYRNGTTRSQIKGVLHMK